MGSFKSPVRASTLVYTFLAMVIRAEAGRIVRMAEADLHPLESDHSIGGTEWALLWKDDFNSFNNSKWGNQLYDGCQYDVCNWGNGEMSWYTSNERNVRVTEGKLVLEAREEVGADLAAVQQSCWDECGQRCAAKNLTGDSLHGCVVDCGGGRCPNVRFTSARIRTYGKYSISPTQHHNTIRIESRMSLPQGTGMWPAFWMLPEKGASDNCTGCGLYGNWPSSGEIDVMEAANNMTAVNGTVHFGGEGQHSHITKGAAIEPGFHTYAIEWEPTQMRWYLDGRMYGSVQSNSAARSGGQGWFSKPSARAATGTPNAPFDVPFHLIINLAVGGQYAGSPAPEEVAQSIAQSQKRMVVDWVRVLGK